MAKGVVLTQTAAKRTANAVRYVERLSDDRMGRGKRSDQILYEPCNLPDGDNTNDILRWEEGGSGSGSGSASEEGRWVIHPAPPTDGDWVLMVRDGVMEWVECTPFSCDESWSDSESQ
jgi:hypothetical protein